MPSRQYSSLRHVTWPQVWVRQHLLPEPMSVLLALEHVQWGSTGRSDAFLWVLRLQVPRGVLPRVQWVRVTSSSDENQLDVPVTGEGRPSRTPCHTRIRDICSCTPQTPNLLSKAALFSCLRFLCSCTLSEVSPSNILRWGVFILPPRCPTLSLPAPPPLSILNISIELLLRCEPAVYDNSSSRIATRSWGVWEGKKGCRSLSCDCGGLFYEISCQSCGMWGRCVG